MTEILNTNPVVISRGQVHKELTPFVDSANELIEQANDAEIKTQKDYDKSTDFSGLCKDALDRASERRLSITSDYRAWTKWVNEQFKPITDSIAEARRIMDDKAIKWHDAEQKRLREEAEIRRRDAEEAALEEAGDAETEAEADDILEMAARAPAPVPEKVVGRGSYTGARADVTYRKTAEPDPNNPYAIRAICRSIANGELPMDIVQLKQGKLNDYARTVDIPDDLEEVLIHGLRVYKAKGRRIS